MNIFKTYGRLKNLPGGNLLFTLAPGPIAPYFASIRPLVAARRPDQHAYQTG